jgi:hypothetical protein
MVRAILEGRKTQTRRIVKPQPMWIERNKRKVYEGAFLTINDNGILIVNVIRSPYGKPGDRLWVRETWQGKPERNGFKPEVAYRATMEGHPEYPQPTVLGKWKPSIHMPRWASRINLEVVSVRVERLQEISHEDAIAEGIQETTAPLKEERLTVPQHLFAHLWDSINKKDGTRWQDNPWVWVVEFKEVPHGL